jgi:NAD(P)-dependent dehydrogenase (short-subunit alcohol dehydrogenase family)
MKPPHALVVGGTRGIGRTVARRFIAEGFALSIIGRRPPEQPLASQKAVRYWAVDLRDADALGAAVPAIVKAGGPLSRLVCLQRFRGAGDEWQGEIDTTLTATRLLIDATSGRFAATGDRAIVVVSSIADRFVASEQPLSYHVAKAGLTQLARYYAVTLARRGIRVNAVSSGTIVKDESRTFYREQKALRQLYESMIPLGRMGTADEIASVVSFLCSGAASFVTGQSLVVDGGVSLQWHETLVRQMSPVRDLAVTRAPRPGRAERRRRS